MTVTIAIVLMLIEISVFSFDLPHLCGVLQRSSMNGQMHAYLVFMDFSDVIVIKVVCQWMIIFLC